MSKLGVFLDDERNPDDVTWIEYKSDIRWYCVINRAVDFMFAISVEEDFSEWALSFDHDIQSFNLNGNELTGYDCLKFLVDRLIDLGTCKNNLPTVYFHTKNPVGKKNMESYWNNFVKSLEEQ